ncbi:hypothetical protein [Bradyrhizobium sp. USDA 4529]
MSFEVVSCGATVGSLTSYSTKVTVRPILKMIAAIFAVGAPLRRPEIDMAAVLARFFPRASSGSMAEIESLVSVAIFSGVGLLTGLIVLLLDQYIPGEWF